MGYCHLDNGCQIATTGLISSNGIARGKDGLIYVANQGKLSVHEEQADHSLVLVDRIVVGMWILFLRPNLTYNSQTAV